MAVEAVSGNGGEAAAPAPAKEVSAKEVVAVSKNASFREESNFLDDLKESERKALADLRDKVEAAIVEGKLFDDGKPEVVKEKEEAKKKAVEKKEEEPETEAKVEEDGKKEADVEEEKKEGEEEGEKKEAEEESGEDTKEEAKKEEAAEKAAAKEEEEKPAETTTAAVVVVDKDIALWGVPLLPSKGDEATDVVLLKFLRARDFKAGAAFEMLRRTLRWRRDWAGFSADADADLPEELAGACYLDGADREGHPVCYNALGVFADDAVYKKALGTEEGKARFLRWRVRAMERHVAELDLRPGGAASLLQVTDLKNSPGPAKKDLRVAVKQVLDLFQDNYPELVARNVSVQCASSTINHRSGLNFSAERFDMVVCFLPADLDQCAVLVLRVQRPLLPVPDAEDQEQVRRCSPVQGHRDPPQVSCTALEHILLSNLARSNVEHICD